MNTPDARLSVFDITNASAPTLMAEIPVGIEPVSVNPRTNDEVWVVNQESDSISVVSVSKGIVTDTIAAKDEPGDVVFAGSNAFVSIAKSNLINVYDVNTHALVQSIPVFGGAPRAMAVSPDGRLVYAAFALSGNATTLISAGKAPKPPPPTNPLLPPAPQVGLIVAATDPNWQSQIRYTMPDNDVVAINTRTLAIQNYVTGVGTLNLGVAVQPSTGFLFVPNTDAMNLTMFQPALRGHWVNNRVSKITTGGTVTAYDLNPGVNYSILPNPAALATALAQPTSAVFDGSGNNLYVAAFGTDRVALMDTNGHILIRIEIGPATGSTVNPATKKGPRGLAINNSSKTLYVMNRISNTISIVSTATNTVTGEVPTGSYDPTPAVITQGRGFLYDAKLSGNGTGSCASCHLDAEMDHISWNLGDPGGSMTTVVSNGVSFQEHPMKGPMTTQMLRGLAGMAPYHWRGDRPQFSSFNPAFNDLMGGPPLSTADMTAYTNFINTVTYMPNPNQKLDRTLPTSIGQQSGSPLAGQVAFTTFQLKSNPVQVCNTCHVTTPGNGSNLNVILLNGATQPFKVPQLRELYQKQLFSETGQTIDGFGVTNDGGIDGTINFIGNPLLFPALRHQTATKEDIASFVSTLDTGTAPAVGYTRTITAATLSNGQVLSDWGTLEAQATTSNADLIAKGTINGQVHGLVYMPNQGNYQADTTGLGPYSHSQLQQFIQNGDTLTFMGVPPGSGLRMGVERKLNGVKDGDSKPR